MIPGHGDHMRQYLTTYIVSVVWEQSEIAQASLDFSDRRSSKQHPVEMYRVQSQWANCCTQTAYISSLATWADAAKDYYFNSKTEEVAKGDPIADHPFQLGAAPWVIRSHSFLFHEQRRYHSCTDYRSHLVYSTAVTRLGKTSLDLEHGIYHEMKGQD